MEERKSSKSNDEVAQKPRAARALDIVKYLQQILQSHSMNLILVLGVLGILVSFYFSEALELPPCDLCWYQRILFYPIPIIAFIALLLKDKQAHCYIFALSIIGLPISIYHHLLKVTDIFPKDTPFCGVMGACSELDWELWNGSGITIPLLCGFGFVAFVLLTGFNVLKISKTR